MGKQFICENNGLVVHLYKVEELYIKHFLCINITIYKDYKGYFYHDYGTDSCKRVFRFPIHLTTLEKCLVYLYDCILEDIYNRLCEE